MRDIRTRLTVVATGVVVVLMALTSIGLLVSQRLHLTGVLDETLEIQADRLVGELDTLRPGDTLAPPVDDDSIAQVVNADGDVVASTPSYEGRPPLAAPAEGRTLEVRTLVVLPGEEPYRMVSRRSGDAVVHVATPLDDIEETMSFLRNVLGVAIPTASALLALVAWVLVGRALSPVEGIRRQVDGIGVDELDQRVPVPDGDDEIARLATTMNRMLDRIEGSVEHQRRFVDDASHELRGPLTAMRAELEIDAAHPEAADRAETQRRVLDEVVALQQLVDDLLLLARQDATGGGRRVPVDLDDLVWSAVGTRRGAGEVGIDTAAVSAAQVTGDPAQLARVVVNLVDNACRHARSSVAIEVGESEGVARLVVADDGSGVAPEDRERIFERFVRLDDARSGGDGGSGLGLAIAREIVVRHGGRIFVDPAAASGARFVVELPASVREGGSA